MQIFSSESWRKRSNFVALLSKFNSTSKIDWSFVTSKVCKLPNRKNLVSCELSSELINLAESSTKSSDFQTLTPTITSKFCLQFRCRWISGSNRFTKFQVQTDSQASPKRHCQSHPLMKIFVLRITSLHLDSVFDCKQTPSELIHIWSFDGVCQQIEAHRFFMLCSFVCH